MASARSHLFYNSDGWFSFETRRLNKNYIFRCQTRIRIYVFILYIQQVPKATLADRANTRKSRLPLSLIQQNKYIIDLTMGRGGWRARSSLNHVLYAARSMLGGMRC